MTVRVEGPFDPSLATTGTIDVVKRLGQIVVYNSSFYELKFQKNSGDEFISPAGAMVYSRMKEANSVLKWTVLAAPSKATSGFVWIESWDSCDEVSGVYPASMNKNGGLAASFVPNGSTFPTEDYTKHILSYPNIIAFWRLNETSGTIVIDYTNHNNTFTLPGSGITRGVTGPFPDNQSAYFFDGSSWMGPIAMTSSPPASLLTVEAWCKGAAVGDVIGANSPAFGADFGLCITGQQLHAGQGDGANWFTTGDNYNGGVPLFGWNHIVALYGPSGQQIWLNNALVASFSYSLSPVYWDSNRHVSVGWTGQNHPNPDFNPDQVYAGGLANVALYNGWLTPAQIASNFAFRG